jgi:hypothetical protein
VIIVFCCGISPTSIYYITHYTSRQIFYLKNNSKKGLHSIKMLVKIHPSSTNRRHTMGRSVSYPSDAVTVCFKDATFIEDSLDWDDYVDDIRNVAQANWRSLRECDEWLGREDRAILENDHAYIGISEYCGLVALWIVAKDHDNETYGLSANWAASIERNFHRTFGEYRKVATMSNGEAFYEKVA